MSPADLFPDLRPWVLNLANVWPAYVVKPQFAQWQVLHILSFTMLGGCVIILNLRLIGVGLTDAPPSAVSRGLRPWLAAAVVGVIASGVLIGMANAERLYDSGAFTAKMAGLLAALVFTYGVVVPTAKADGRVGRGAGVAAVAALAVWAFALWVFATGELISPGVFHLIAAAALIVAVTLKGRTRWVYLAGLGALIIGQSVWTHGFITDDDLARLDPLNKAFAWALSLWIVANAARPLLARDAGAPRPLPQLIGYAGILMWIGVAAAGRWIAFA